MANYPFLEKLNPEQYESVVHTDGSLLILAGAGSGKTRVLTSRIAWLLHTHKARPNEILAVTFTNKAAREMVSRISAMLPFTIDRAWIGTFHGLCNRLLRMHAAEAGLSKSFQILDSSDQLAMVKRILKASNIPEDRFRPTQVTHFINSQKELGHRADRVPEDGSPWTQDLIGLYATYERQCQAENLVDFAELLLRSYELLNRNQVLREHYQQRFRHILIDEFQDTNNLQYEWLKLLAGKDNTLFAVGDDDQSIYSFRGANTANMQRFVTDFQVKNIIRLEQNYRSFGHILNAANAVISCNNSRLGKNLWTDAGEGEPINCYEAQTDMSEAKWIVTHIEKAFDQGIKPNDIAVLYRSNAQSRVLEHALFSAGVPYRVYGGLRFFERMEIKHALAYLRLIANTSDDQAFSRIVNFPPRGIGAKSVERLQAIAQSKQQSLFSSIPEATGRSATALSAFGDFITDFSQKARDLPLATLVTEVVETSGLVDYYRHEKDGADRIDNLQELVSAATLFATETKTLEEGVSMLDAFLAHASLEAGDYQKEQGQEAIQLMTIHAAKGLEFDTVFLTGVEEGLLPHENSLTESHAIEEERRLMYVAMTRARRQLWISMSKTRMLHGQSRYNLRSRFLDEIPAETTTWQHEFVYDHGKKWDAALQEDIFVSSPSKKTRTGSKWNIGQRVKHAKFGEGTILALEGKGNDARVQVRFGGAGTKWLALEYAKLSHL